MPTLVSTHHQQALIRLGHVVEIEDAPPNLPQQVRAERDECPPRNLQRRNEDGEKSICGLSLLFSLCCSLTHHRQDIALYLLTGPR